MVTIPTKTLLPALHTAVLTNNSYSQQQLGFLQAQLGVGPKAYMSTDVTPMAHSEQSTRERFERCLGLMEHSPASAHNALEALQFINTTITLEETAYWGDNNPRQGRMYPLTLLGTRTLEETPDVSVLVSAKQATLIGATGAFQVWSRDDTFNDTELHLGDMLLDKPSANGEHLNLIG
jgi:hypothetical protein